MPSPSTSADRDRVLDAVDLVALIGEHVVLKPKGREHVGLCPFHDDRSPSLAVVTHKGGSFYKCFACGAGGNAIDFMMEFHKLSFPDALKHLAERAGIQLTERFARSSGPGLGKESLLAANEFAMRWFRRGLAEGTEGDGAAAAREVVRRRGISPASIDAFRLGYAPDRRDGLASALKRRAEHRATTNRGGDADRTPAITLDTLREAGLLRESGGDLLRHRLVFPICDELGRPIAFGGRKLRDEDEPKYINSPETPLFHKSRSLYGIHLAKQAIVKSRTVIVTEGYTDVIACHAAGFTNTVATLGTALTREHARLLRRLGERVILLFDGDAAGLRAAERGVEVFFAEPIDVAVCTLPDALDPDELLRDDQGRARFQDALDRSVDALAFMVERFRREYASKSGLSGRQQVLEGLLGRLAELGFGAVSGVRKRFILSSLAHLTRLSEREIESALSLAVGSIRRPIPAKVASPAESDRDAPPPRDDSEDLGPPISRARREAERHLVATLLMAPECADTPVEIDLATDSSEGAVAAGATRGSERTTLPLLEVLGDGCFADPRHRTIFGRWRHLVAAGERCGPPQLLAELADPGAKGLASELFVLGEVLVSGASTGGDGTPKRSTLARLVVEAFADLDRVARRERQALSSPDVVSSAPRDGALDLASALDRIARRRVRGADPTVAPGPASGPVPVPVRASHRPSSPTTVLPPSASPR